MSPKQLEDVLDCGNAQETWQEMVAHFKQRAASERQIAFELEQESHDVLARSAEHHGIAADFDPLATALLNANVDFAKVEKAA